MAEDQAKPAFGAVRLHHECGALAHGGGDCCAISGAATSMSNRPACDAGALDPLAVEVMAEIGIALGHHPRRFEDLQDGCFDLVMTLSPEAAAPAPWN